MSKARISESLMGHIRAASGKDKKVAEFLIELAYEETDQSAGSHYKEIYLRLLKKYAVDWQGKK